jgi:small subunit ribosomal protein S16
MLTIRLSRTGKSKQPYYRLVVQEKGRDPWSPAVEVIGNLNPRAERKDTVVNVERAQYWLSKGAQPSDTVHNLFVEMGIIKADKVRNTQITAARAKKMAEAAKSKEV